MRESPECAQWQSPPALIRNAAIVLWGSSSADIAVSLITTWASRAICISIAAASSLAGA